MSGYVGVLNNRLNCEIKPNPHANSGLGSFAGKVCDTAKGVSDVFGLLLKGTQLFHAVLPHAATPFSERVQIIAGAGRDMTSIPRAIVVANKVKADGDYRDVGELGKVTALSVAALHPDRTAAQTCIGVATMTGVVVDSVDLLREAKLRSVCADEAPKATNANVKKALDNQVWISTVKIAKICLQLFGGIVGSMTWLLAITLEAPLALAALVASFSAILLSFGIQYTEYTSELASKFTLLQPKEIAVAG